MCLLLGSCAGEAFLISPIEPKYIENYSPGFKALAESDLTINFEQNSVQASFFGDYKTALDQATKRQLQMNVRAQNSTGIQQDSGILIEKLREYLTDSTIAKEEQTTVRAMLNSMLSAGPEDNLKVASSIAAVEFIAEKAGAYHFTLINEAHYDSQHRAFTKELLGPLWKQGYRYLALEGLGYTDTSLHKRAYPVFSTGYYVKDSSYGNMVREALQIGYRLIAYETQRDVDGTLRDGDQADNIIEQTWAKDNTGKVLIHAGYSHIVEVGDKAYKPLGSQLIEKLGQDVLTVDQVTMSALADTSAQHPLYRQAERIFKFTDPRIFIVNGQPIVELNGAVDIQVFHPRTRFENGRPHWLLNTQAKPVDLSLKLKGYRDHLIQAVNLHEAVDAVPIDQFIAGACNTFILPAGYYRINIINPKGVLIGSSTLQVRE